MIYAVDLGVTFACRLLLVIGNNHVTHVVRVAGFQALACRILSWLGFISVFGLLDLNFCTEIYDI